MQWIYVGLLKHLQLQCLKQLAAMSVNNFKLNVFQKLPHFRIFVWILIVTKTSVNLCASKITTYFWWNIFNEQRRSNFAVEIIMQRISWHISAESVLINFILKSKSRDIGMRRCNHFAMQSCYMEMNW